MSQISDLETRIEDYIYENGVQAITGQIMQNVLKDVVETIDSVKQDAESGKGLSEEDFTTTLKQKLEAIEGVYIATPGTTTFAEITAAAGEGQVVLAVEDGVIFYYLQYLDDTVAGFASSNVTGVYSYSVTADGWTAMQNEYEQTSNKTASIDAASTDTQYPTAKSVYDFVGVLAQVVGALNELTTTNKDSIVDAINEVDASKQDVIDAGHKLDYSLISNTPTIDSALDSSSENAVQNKVVKAAIDDVASDVSQLGLEVDEKLPKMVSITWSALKALRDGGTLVPGCQYRITDYQCTTVQDDTHSAGNQFDIIVTADSANTLNENARACLHDGNTYFANSNLEAWRLQYCLDNDTERFAWADSTNGKGVIYRMIDEWENDCPYDFKNIQFKRDLLSLPGTSAEESENVWCYTFSCFDDGISNGSEPVDESVVAKDHIQSDEDGIFGNNIIGVYYSIPGVIGLNDIIFITDWGNEYIYHFSNAFGYNCHSNTFGDNCHSNTFGYNCHSNTFGNHCYSNTFGDNCSSNTFGNDCNSNTFGDNYHSNTFGGSCYSNTFGESCHSNTFGESCQSNTFGYNCHSNTFGFHCYSNTFGNDCQSNIFGNVSPINYVQYIRLGDGCKYLHIFSSDTSATDYNQLQNVSIAQGVQGTSDNHLTITIPDRNLSYETKVGYNSSGVLKIYCEADLV